MVLNFSNEVAEDEIISIIQYGSLAGKLGGLSVHVSYLIPHDTQTLPTTPGPKSNGLYLPNVY